MEKLEANDPDQLRAHQDILMEREINRKLSAISTWDTTDIRASVEQAVVSLSGTVTDTKALEQTVLVVFTVKGLKRIDNKLKIRRESVASLSHTAADTRALPDDDREK
ncbi:MAG: BON domain-containing protein [Chitinophagaceae bacterium]|nr:MAG: BON domain-containing protein [Chitinophagaceae bacterium]